MSLPFESEYNTEIVTEPMKQIAWNKGKTNVYSDATIRAMTYSAKNRSPGHNEKIRQANLGKTHTAEIKAKISQALRNSEAHKKGIANRDMSIVSKRMKQWHKTPEKIKQHREHNLKQKRPVVTPLGQFAGTIEAQLAHGFKSKTSVIQKCYNKNPKYADWYYIEETA
jgi:hypothetical protein